MNMQNRRNDIRNIKFHGLHHNMGKLLIEDEGESQIDHILMASRSAMDTPGWDTTDIYVHLTKKVKKRTTSQFDKFARQPTQKVSKM